MIPRLLSFLCGLALCIGFFLPWVKVSIFDFMGLSNISTQLKANFSMPDILNASAFDIVMKENTETKTRILLLCCPTFGMLLILASFINRWVIGTAAFLSGCLLLGYPLFHISKILYHTTGPGLWLVIGSALFSFFFGLIYLITVTKSAHKKPQKEG